MADITDLAKSQGKQKLELAVATFEASKAALYREDGKAIFSQEEHAVRLAAITTAFEATCQEVHDLAMDFEKIANEALLLEDLDPVLELGSAALQAANQAGPFVRDACNDMPLEALARRLQATALHGDKTQKVLYARYAQARVDAIEGEIQKRSRANQPLNDDLLDGLSELRKAVEQLHGSFSCLKAVKRM
jgi:hypothetical protein